MLSGIFGPITEWIKEQREMRIMQEEANRQIAMEQMKMAAEAAKADGVATNTRLKSTGRDFKYITFWMWFTPFILGIVKPDMAAVIFQHFDMMPPWYSQSCTLLIFAVWGISVSAPVVTSIFSNLGSYIANGRQADREHRENLARINRDAVFASLRKAQGALSQQTVNEVDAALDAGEAASNNMNDATDQALNG